MDGAGVCELFLSERADRFQQSVADMTADLVAGDEGLADQRINSVEQGVFVDVSAHVGDGGEVEAIREYGCVLEHEAFVVVEEFVGPLHGEPQRLVAFQPAARPGEETEPVAETVADVLWGHRHHSCGGEFDEPCSVRELWYEFRRNLDGEPGVADPTDAGQRDEPGGHARVR